MATNWAVNENPIVDEVGPPPPPVPPVIQVTPETTWDEILASGNFNTMSGKDLAHVGDWSPYQFDQWFATIAPQVPLWGEHRFYNFPYYYLTAMGVDPQVAHNYALQRATEYVTKRDAEYARQKAASRANFRKFATMLPSAVLGGAALGGGLGAGLGGHAAGALATEGAAMAGMGGLPASSFVAGTGGLGASGGMLGSLTSAYDAASPLTRALVNQAVKTGVNLATGGEFDPLKVAFGLAGPLANAAWAGAGFGGMFGSAPPLGYMSNMDLGSFDDIALPLGYMSDMDLGSFEDIAAASPGYFPAFPGPVLRIDELGALQRFNPFARTMSVAPGYNATGLPGMEVTQSFVMPDAFEGIGDFDASAPFIDEAFEMGGEALANAQSAEDALDQPDAPPAEEALDEPFTSSEPDDPFTSSAPDKPFTPFGQVKPSTVLAIAQRLLGLLGKDGSQQAKALRRVVEREYANDAERQAAYMAYAEQLLGFVPSVSEAFALDPRNVNTRFGDTFVDPNTGEVRYRLEPGTQAYFDALLQRSKDVLDRGLGLDTDSVAAGRLEQMIAALADKREKDMAALTRALYAKGLLGLVTYQGAGVNLLTGETETWSLGEGQGANPYFAAEFARRERENYDLARKSRADAESYLQHLLNFSGGIFGKARDVDQEMLGALFDSGTYTDETGEVRQRGARGLFDLMAGPGGVFMQQLMGSLPSGKAAAALADVDYLRQLREEEAIRRMMEGWE